MISRSDRYLLAAFLAAMLPFLAFVAAAVLIFPIAGGPQMVLPNNLEFDYESPLTIRIELHSDIFFPYRAVSNEMHFRPMVYTVKHADGTSAEYECEPHASSKSRWVAEWQFETTPIPRTAQSVSCAVTHRWDGLNGWEKTVIVPRPRAITIPAE